MNDIWQDVKFGARLLWRTPLLTLVAALSLALGVGANTTVFSLVKAVFLEPLPVRDASTLVSVFRTVDSEMGGAGGGLLQTAFANYEDTADRATSFSDLLASTFGPFSLASGGEPEQVFGSFVTTNYFRTLGIEPLHGRFFAESDEREQVVVLAHGLWTRRFGASPGIVGETIRLNGRPFSVIGVAPSGFKGLFTLGNQELFVPVHLQPEMNEGLMAQALEHRGLRLFSLVGRLAPGIERETVGAELDTIALALEEEHPDWNRDRGFAVLSLNEATLDPNQRATYVRAGTVLAGAVGLVLAIACANVASLLLGRSRSRGREIAMRLALGASRGRLMRQLLTESMMLALLGAVLGVFVAAWTQPLLWRLRPPFLPEGSLDLGFDATVLAFTTLVALAAGALFGLAPAWQASRADLIAATKERGEEAWGRTGRGAPLRQTIVAGQAALSYVAIAAAGLFMMSLANAQAIDPGFDHEGLAVASFDLGAQNYTSELARTRLDEIERGMVEIPGVEHASLATVAPLSFTGAYRVLPLGTEGRAGTEGVYISNTSVTPAWFQTLGLAAMDGRLFDSRDRRDGRQVVVVNQTLAETFWPGERVIGRQLSWPAAEGPWDIVGVVPDMKYTTLGEDPQPFFYRPLDQEFFPSVTLHVKARAEASPETVLPLVLGELRRLDPDLPVTNAVTLPQALDQSLWAARLGATLLSVFGILALVLASIGIYGVLLHATESRRREIGIRMALGADRFSMVRQVVGKGLAPVAFGLAAGGLAALATLRLAANLLYGLSGTEPSVFVGAGLALVTVALVASIVPALKTTRVDPVTTLRSE